MSKITERNKDMEKEIFYHITSSENFESIKTEGILADKCKSGAIALCNSKSVPYWQILLGKDVLLEVDVLKRYEPLCVERYRYKEFFYYKSIPAEDVRQVVWPDNRMAMHELCIEYIGCVNNLVDTLNRYYHDEDLDGCSHKTLEKQLKVILDILPKLDYGTVPVSALSSELADIRYCGSNYMFDCNPLIGKHYYEEIVDGEQDDLLPMRAELKNWISENLSRCLQVKSERRSVF